MTRKRKGWTHVRIRKATKERLAAHCRRMTAAVQAGRSTRELSDQPVIGGAQGGVTFDRAINDALDREDEHLARARKQSAKRKAQRLHDADVGQPAPELDLAEFDEHVAECDREADAAADRLAALAERDRQAHGKEGGAL